MIVNNWFVIEIGLEAATQTKWVRLFFFSFHLFGVILVNNLVIACIINKFLQQHTVFSFEQKDEVVGDGQAILVGHRHALFNASSITGTRTSLKGDYIVQLRYTHADLDGFHHRERLRSLFTQTSRSTALIDENSR